MSCQRCGGLLVPDNMLDLNEEYSQMWCQGFRCINCGWIEEPLIRLNREAALRPPILMPPRRGARPPRPRTGCRLDDRISLMVDAEEAGD